MSFALNAVYNNYLTTYSPKSVSKYDTHKKSDLQKVYSSIVKLNKEAPWYLPTTGKDTQEYAITLKENARQLHNTIAQLGGMEENGLFSKKSAYSTNPDVVSATYVGPQVKNNVTPQFEIQVEQLASPQENLGLFLNNEKVKLPTDTYSFDLSINDMNYEFQFAISDTETNKGIQERLIRLINGADIGIKATLAESESRYSIRLYSEGNVQHGGKQQIFSISDEKTSKRAGAVEYFGLDYVSHEATEAVYRVNGERRTADTNHFTVGQMFELELNGITQPEETIQIGLKTDIESLTDNVNHLIGSYNDFVKAASEYSDRQSLSRKLIHEMTGIASSYSRDMFSTGLNLQADGSLSIDQELLRQTAMDSQDVSATFHYLKDFSGRLMRKSDQVSINPMDYVDKKVVAYKNPGHNFVSPYTTSTYSGMLFNGYC